MADPAKGRDPSGHVQFPVLYPDKTQAVIDDLVDACQLAHAELISLYENGYSELAEAQTPVRRRLLWACAAVECLRFGAIPAVDALLKMQADADALEGEVNP